MNKDDTLKYLKTLDTAEGFFDSFIGDFFGEENNPCRQKAAIKSVIKLLHEGDSVPSSSDGYCPNYSKPLP